MAGDCGATALQASEDEERERDPRESARRGHRRAMRHMTAEARRRYANSMDNPDERDMVGAISAELDDEDREGRRAEDERKDEDGDNLDARIAQMVKKYGDTLKAEFDVRNSKFLQDNTPRVAEISARLSQAGMSPKPFQMAVATRGLQAAIADHVPDHLRRDTSVAFDGAQPGDAPALQAAVGGQAFVGIKSMLGAVA